jgi:nucleoid-associated protein YgaU
MRVKPITASTLVPAIGGVLVNPDSFFEGFSGNGQSLAPRLSTRPARRQPLRPVVGTQSQLVRTSTVVRRRVAMLIASAGLVAAVVAGGGAASADAKHQRVRSADQHVVVRSGDSIWIIARRIQPEGDVRPLVDSIVLVNGSSAILVGQILTIPAQG